MEDDKKKKRNKKKKNKQSKAVEDRVDGSGEAVSGDQILVNHGKNENGQFLETANVPGADVDSNGHRANGEECANPEEINPKWREENDIHIHNDAKSDETIRKLVEQNDMHIYLYNAISQETIKKLKEEINRHIQKEAFSEETIRKLKETNDILIQKEAISKEKIRKLKEESDTHIQKEAKSQDAIRKLKEEIDRHIQKEAFLAETFRKLKEQNNIHIQNEVSLEETINKLRAENELQMQKQADLEMQIVQLHGEKRSLIHKEVSWEEIVNKLKAENELQMRKQAGLELQVAQLQGEKESLIHKEESLEERIKVLETDLSSSIEKQNSTKETILKLNGDVNRMQAQVAELEQSKDSLLLENKQLMGNVSDLQSAIENLQTSSSPSFPLDASAKDNGSEHENLKAQIEAALMLVDKLVEENAGLVEKVNELYVELDQRSAVNGFAGATYPMERADEVTEFVKPNGEFIPMPESSEITPVSSQELEGAAPIKDSSDTLDVEHATPLVTNASIVSDDSGEIVQIPLDDNEVRDPELRAAKDLELDAVPLTDAPLIGAPFRLISFVAKYVSGADLVNKSTSNTSH